MIFQREKTSKRRFCQIPSGKRVGNAFLGFGLRLRICGLRWCVMNLDPELTKLLNAQINHEMAASYSYLAMAAWFEQTPYAGFANWMYLQSAEETVHAHKFYQFLVDRGAKVVLEPLAAPQADFKSPLDAFSQSLKQEQEVSKQINVLYDVAERVRDHASKNLLLWFLNEQIEEEKSVGDIVDRLTLAGDDPASLLALDSEAAARNSGGK